MAGIDKIYGTQAQYDEFHAWMRKEKPEFLNYFYSRPLLPSGMFPLTNFPSEIDTWLYNNCPLKWVQEAIREQYNGAPRAVSHTPGPWTTKANGYRNQMTIEPCIGAVYGAGEELKANARLIAAAPDLLEALEACVEQLDHVPNDCWATGPFTGNALQDLVACPGCAALKKARAAIAKAKAKGEC